MTVPAPFDPAFDVLRPTNWTIPLLCNSPHSGRVYPPAFLAQSQLGPRALRRSEDFRIDELFACATGLGAPLLRAHFPRCFLDVNREPYELDPRLITERLPGFANAASPRVLGGLGTVPRVVSEGEEIYRGPIALADALARIEAYYRPYHRELTQLIAEAMSRFGRLLLVDCHSMPSSAAGHLPGPQPDIVLGDRFGMSCAEEFTAGAEAAFRREGFVVTRNKPYAGGFIVQNYGAPRRGINALQIEVNRGLYMDERSIEPSPRFARTAERIAAAMALLAAGLADRLPVAAE